MAAVRPPAKSPALLAAEAELARLEHSIAIENQRREAANRAKIEPRDNLRPKEVNFLAKPSPSRTGKVNSVSVGPQLPKRTPPSRNPSLGSLSATSSATRNQPSAPAPRTPSRQMLGGVSLSGAPLTPRMSSLPGGMGGIPAMSGLSGGPMMPSMPAHGLGGMPPMPAHGMGGMSSMPGMMRPPAGSKDLPEPALLLLRELWTKLGYEGPAFVEMQMEIGRELEHAEFSRFEREMLCNEIMALRRELNGASADRTEMMRRLELQKNQLTDVMQAEERTYRTLLSEREGAQRSIMEAEEVAHTATLDAEKEAVKVSVLSQEVERLEHDRATAVIQSKRLEKRLAELLAATKPTGGVLKDKKKEALQELDTATLGWTQADEDALAAKINERRLAAEEARLAAEERRIVQERAKMKMEKDRLERMKLEPPERNIPKNAGNGGNNSKVNANGNGGGRGGGGGERPRYTDDGGYDGWDRDDEPRRGGSSGHGGGGRPKAPARQRSRSRGRDAAEWDDYDDYESDSWMPAPRNSNRGNGGSGGSGGGGGVPRNNSGTNWGAANNTTSRQGSTIPPGARTPGKRNTSGGW